MMGDVFWFVNTQRASLPWTPSAESTVFAQTSGVAEGAGGRVDVDVGVGVGVREAVGVALGAPNTGIVSVVGGGVGVQTGSEGWVISTRVAVGGNGVEFNGGAEVGGTVDVHWGVPAIAVRVRKTAVCISSALRREPSVAAIWVERDWMVAASDVS